MSQHFVLCSYHDRSLMRLARGRIGEGGEGEECQAACSAQDARGRQTGVIAPNPSANVTPHALPISSLTFPPKEVTLEAGESVYSR